MYAMTRLVPLPLSVPTPRNLRMRRALDYLHRKLGGVISERRSEPDTGDVLSLLLAARDEDGDPMSDRQLLDEVITLTGAAQETSADGQAWTMYLLAKHPEVRERLRSEVDDVLGAVPVTAERMRRLPYAMQVYKESLRLYPPAAVMLRSAIRNTTIGGYRVPRGTVVLISPYGLHRRPDAFPDPERFDPDRFAKENEQKLPKHAFLPFGGGQHVCVGSHLALLEGQVLTATLARRVEFELVAGHPVDPVLLVNLRPRNGIRVRVRKRENAPPTPVATTSSVDAEDGRS
jgi:cytochrome P450